MTVTEVIFAFTAAGILVYAGIILLCWYLWSRLSGAPFRAGAKLPTVTLVIVARNEQENIGRLIADLCCQTYPTQFFDVLLMDDGSTDLTVSIAQQEAKKRSISLSTIPVDIPPGFTGGHKKLAIMQAALLSQADIILLTDADCRVGQDWIASHIAYYQNYPGTKLVFGSFLFEPKRPFWNELLNLEAINLAGVSAATNFLQKPGMCSGANLSCRREIYAELSPYKDNLFLASGDDEFLLHTVLKHFPGSTFYNRNPESLVFTSPPASLGEFFNQRKRWAGKWRFYSTSWPLMLALVVVAGNLSNLLAWILFLLSGNYVFLLLILMKWIPDLLLSHRVSTHFKRNTLLRLFIPMEIIYPFYAFFFAIASNFGNYRWKGRTYP